MKHLLTKSKYIRGLQCEKAMFLEVYNPKLARYSAETLAKFRGGRDFERTFKDTFPTGIDVSKVLRWQMDKYPAYTSELLRQEGDVVLFEAGFLYDDVLVLADVVHKNSDGGIEIYEVKNGSSVTDTFRNDVAIQQYVVRGALREWGTGDLFAPNFDLQHFYVLYNGGEEGFRQEDLLLPSREREKEVCEHVAHFKEVLSNEEPQTPMSEHCDIPYECPFKHYCGRKIKKAAE